MSKTDWQALVEGFSASAQRGELNDMLQFFLTPDEREALLVRAKILHGLLNQSKSQRQLSQDLGVGIATITRGSHELKRHDEQQKMQLAQFLETLFSSEDSN